ncbi:MAG: hypothetical protein ACI9J4_000431, partial [Paraglaciecola sp.]
MNLLKVYTLIAFGLICFGITFNSNNDVAINDFESTQIIAAGSKQKPPMLIAAGSKQKPPMLIAAGSKQKPPMLIAAGSKQKPPMLIAAGS